MNESSPFTRTGRARRLIVTIVIGTVSAVTAAAVTTGLALNEHPPSAFAGRAAVRTAVPDALAPAPLHPRRVEWRDPWKHPASDPSVPAAAKALEGVPDASSGEPAPTF